MALTGFSQEPPKRLVQWREGARVLLQFVLENSRLDCFLRLFFVWFCDRQLEALRVLQNSQIFFRTSIWLYPYKRSQHPFLQGMTGIWISVSIRDFSAHLCFLHRLGRKLRAKLSSWESSLVFNGNILTSELISVCRHDFKLRVQDPNQKCTWIFTRFCCAYRG